MLGLFSLVLAWATRGPHYPLEQGAIHLRWSHLPLYALYSWLRMAAAYCLSLLFALVYAYLAAFHRRAERVLIPVLDILQSIPVLSFLPVVLEAFIALFPGSRLGVNLAAIILIFTGQVWNMVFSLYHGFITIPRDLRESALSLRLSAWQRFRALELPYAMVGLVYNSMMSWAGGWFFLMACEMFSLGSQNYQLEGLGSYLQTAANRGDWRAEGAGLIALVSVIVLMDQLIWRPLLAWADRFKMELVEGEGAGHSAVLRVLRRSQILSWSEKHLCEPAQEALDQLFTRLWPKLREQPGVESGVGLLRTLAVAAAIYALFSALRGAAALLATLPLHAWALVLAAAATTLLRVLVALAFSVAWTVPVGVWIGLNKRWSATLTPLSQIAASVPATALFPGLVALLIHLRGGLEVASVLLMVLGTQWYVLFNVIAGASAIPEDLKEATRIFGLGGWFAWRTLILPAIFPYLVTGLITAAGGAWNASIVAEYVSFQGKTYTAFGIGSLIAQSSQGGQYALLLASTGMLALTVVAINRMVWRRLYEKASQRYSFT
ncbi:MAG: ABC transporter permease subunit [Firmicutes bacterium]|nr:ABC transporter permease subunit [Bacillota bacterium]